MRQQEDTAISEELGDREGVAAACCNLGDCYVGMEQYVRALELQQEAKAIFEELGYRAGEAAECGNLGICYHPSPQLHATCWRHDGRT